MQANLYWQICENLFTWFFVGSVSISYKAKPCQGIEEWIRWPGNYRTVIYLQQRPGYKGVISTIRVSEAIPVRCSEQFSSVSLDQCRLNDHMCSVVMVWAGFTCLSGYFWTTTTTDLAEIRGRRKSGLYLEQLGFQIVRSVTVALKGGDRAQSLRFKQPCWRSRPY